MFAKLLQLNLTIKDKLLNEITELNVLVPQGVTASEENLKAADEKAARIKQFIIDNIIKVTSDKLTSNQQAILPHSKFIQECAEHLISAYQALYDGRNLLCFIQLNQYYMFTKPDAFEQAESCIHYAKKMEAETMSQVDYYLQALMITNPPEMLDIILSHIELNIQSQYGETLDDDDLHDLLGLFLIDYILKYQDKKELTNQHQIIDWAIKTAIPIRLDEVYKPPEPREKHLFQH